LIMEKINPSEMKKFFVLGQIAILAVAMGGLFLIMASSQKSRGLDILMSKVDLSAAAMASQLKANQVPSEGSTERGTFIINQKDGSVVIDRHDDAPAEKQLWESYRTKLIYEMQKQKNGWITYPDRSAWNFNQSQRIIRYLSIDELGWILAIEVAKPTEFQLLMGSIGGASFFGLWLLFGLGAGGLWFLTKQYLDLIKKNMSTELEEKLMNLSGEDKGWVSPQTPAKEVVPEHHVIRADEREVFLEKKPIAEETILSKKVRKVVVPEPISEEFKPVVEQKPVQQTSSDPLTINVKNIKSPVLKKMLQQFRDR
jgi:hypothetical protein